MPVFGSTLSLLIVWWGFSVPFFINYISFECHILCKQQSVSVCVMFLHRLRSVTIYWFCGYLTRHFSTSKCPDDYQETTQPPIPSAPSPANKAPKVWRWLYAMMRLRIWANVPPLPHIPKQCGTHARMHAHTHTHTQRDDFNLLSV